MKEGLVSFRAFFALLLLLLFPIILFAKGEGKTDIKAVSNSLVSNTDGQTLKLGDTWQEKPVVLVFIRHFG